MLETETKVNHVAQYRVKSHSSNTWGSWVTVEVLPDISSAIGYVTRQREVEENNPRADMEWRVLKVTQEVVY